MMKVSPLAGTPAPASMLVNVARLVTAYYAQHPDSSVPAERVAFGTSGHRGSAFDRTFNEAHILAITQAICSYRRTNHIDGPLFMGMDTHGLSEPAFASALEVLGRQRRRGDDRSRPRLYAGADHFARTPVYERIDAPATVDQKRLLRQLSPAVVDAKELAGETIRSITTTAPGNGASIGGLNVIAESGWFAVRPSATENVYMLYAVSFRDRTHLERNHAEGQALVTTLFAQSQPFRRKRCLK